MHLPGCQEQIFVFCAYLFIWLHEVLVAACGIFCCGAWTLQLWHAGFSCSVACKILVLQLGIELVSPALQGGFLTTGPPGKFQVVLLMDLILYC